jgi:hypothetical protein
MAPAKISTFPAKPVVPSFLDRIATPEFVSVAIFCAVGLLLTLNVVLRMPDLGAFLG